ncbi:MULTISPECIES: hypothetical protein [Methylorubrum]|uniref:hypothetical protein n=1 Tax=Methylorubrum TaxID=2282523 RepID=UPI00209FF56B|nr:MULTISPECIES: hypothetical protein [Methylorubrum]MCP1547001.1 hypothetical protein [Methylorubrum zatmanii]MCP1551720.1 hypothetical protein [Methylorubrum extorquens]MCP1577304.1 hypothetical protein [Methylorubrum extorquens]
MTHALMLPALAADGDRVPFHADPMLAAVERHSEAWAVFQVAQPGADSERADDDMQAALMALLGTACATRGGAFCLIQHLRWWLAEEAPNAGAYGDAWAIARAREADLSKFLGVERIERRPLVLPSGRMLAPLAERHPVPASARNGNLLAAAGEALSALIIVAGGACLTGFASQL